MCESHLSKGGWVYVVWINMINMLISEIIIHGYQESSALPKSSSIVFGL